MTKKMLIAALLACAFGPALADEMALGEFAGFAGVAGFEDEPRVERRIVTRTGNGPHMIMADEVHRVGLRDGAAVMHLHPGRLVKNAPYSAEMVSERIQTLGDGNQITSKTSSMSYRDSAGRTRTEVRNDEGEVVSVTIHDPVAGLRYVLRPRDKTAIRVKAPDATAMMAREAGVQARIAAEQARARVEELRREGKLPDGGREGVRERVIVKQVERSGGLTGEFKDVQIRIAQVGPGPGAAGAQLGPVVARAIGEGKWAAKAETKELGTREFNGLKATGVQRSYEIPAGEIGNRNPIVVSTETWTSPELQAVVYQKRSDPRSGDFVFRLESLKREEPAAALFTVPSDYTVKDPATMAKEALEKAKARARPALNG